MAEIKNDEELEIWLKGKPLAVAQVIAARAALRVMPFIKEPKTRANLTGAVFRALFISWATCNYLAPKGISARAALAADAAYAAYTAYVTDDAYSALAAFAASRASRAARTGAYPADVIDAADVAADVAHSIDTANSTVLIWGTVELDVNWLEASTNVDPALAARDLAATRLWSDAIPTGINEQWQKLKKDLLSLNEDWDIWTDWYEQRLKGSAVAFMHLHALYDDVTLTIAMEDNAFWERDPAIVNAEIKARLIAGRPPVETAVSDLVTNTKPKARAKSTPKTEVKPKTKIGKAVLTNHGQIVLQSAAITVLIAERLTLLQAQCPNSDEAIADRNNEIAELEKWQVIVTDVKTHTDGFAAGETKEAELATIVGVLKAAIIEYIKKNGTEALGMTVKTAIISLAMTLACFCGIPGIIGITAIGSVVGGKTFVDALKSAKGIGKTAIRK